MVPWRPAAHVPSDAVPRTGSWGQVLPFVYPKEDSYHLAIPTIGNVDVKGAFIPTHANLPLGLLLFGLPRPA